jgi:hypothetical protein
VASQARPRRNKLSVSGPIVVVGPEIDSQARMLGDDRALNAGRRPGLECWATPGPGPVEEEVQPRAALGLDFGAIRRAKAT